MANFATFGFAGVIVKPYKYTELIKLMDEVLR